MNDDLRKLLDPSNVEARGRTLRLPKPRVPKIAWRPRRPWISWRPSADLFADVALLAGLASIASGCGWIFPPTAPIVGGVFLAAVAWTAGRPTPQTQEIHGGKVERWYSTDTRHPADDEDD